MTVAPVSVKVPGFGVTRAVRGTREGTGAGDPPPACAETPLQRASPSTKARQQLEGNRIIVLQASPARGCCVRVRTLPRWVRGPASGGTAPEAAGTATGT